MAIDRRAARLSALAIVGVVLVSLLGVRLWFLQTVEAEDLQADIDVAQTRTVPLVPERGRIIDADGRVLADNKRILTLAVDYQFIRRDSNREEIFTRLSGWVGIPVEDMEAEWDRQIHSPFLPFPIKRDIDEQTATAILERIEDFPGVSVETDWERVYPYAPHAAHVIGYMGAIQDGQEEQYKDYLLDERVGQFGVERELESILHGKWGYRTMEVDASNRPIRVIEEFPPVNGYDVQLTIDLDLQQYVEQSVETTLRARRDVTAPNPLVSDVFTGRVSRMDPELGDRVYFKAPAGSAVVMNYLTGEVAALASYPTFDNRWFEAGISGEKFGELFPDTDDPDQSILVNRAIQGRYNVGSTFKPFTAFAALSTGLIGPGSSYYDSGTYKLESIDDDVCNSGVRCVYKNAICYNGKPCVYGSVNVTDALAVSSDAFFYRIGERIMIGPYQGLTLLQDAVREFGFGSDSGIELPFEFDGTVPDAELKARYAELGVITEAEGRDYYQGDNVQLAIGQGLLSATPLQLANAYGALANGGFVYQPTIIKAIFPPGTPEGEPGLLDVSAAGPLELEEYPNPPILKQQVAMSASTHDAIVRGLRRVVQQNGGANGRTTTAEELYFDWPSSNIQIAGKTGTAQGFGNYPWNDSSVFVGFAVDPSSLGPDEENPWVVSAFLEKAGYGSTAAAPLVKCVFSALSGNQTMDEVILSSPLDLNQEVAALRMQQPNPTSCWTRKDAASSVYYEQRSVD